MGTWTIANVDSELVQRISALPDGEREALERNIIGVAERRFAMTRMDRRKHDAARIRAMTPKGVVQTDSTLLIREDRDR